MCKQFSYTKYLTNSTSEIEVLVSWPVCGFSRFYTSIDVSSPHTADRDPSRSEGKMEIGSTNQSRVNKPAGQWEPGGKDATLMPTPPPQLESCLRGQGGEVDERGRGREGRQVKLTQDTAVQRKIP